MLVKINLHSITESIEFSLIPTATKSCGRRGCCAELGKREEGSFVLNKRLVSLTEMKSNTETIEISNYHIAYFLLFVVLILFLFVMATYFFKALGDVGALSVAIGLAVGLSVVGKVLLDFLITREIMPKFKICYAKKS